MHCCLRTPELVRLICEHASLSSLAALARTCCFFHDPALTVLWRDIPSISPLLTCFPIDLVDDDDSHSLWSTKDAILMLQRPLIPSDWDRFATYAARVRTLGFSDQAKIVEPHIDRRLIHAMVLASKGAKLLPNVRAVSWNVPYAREDLFSFIHQILGPELTKLKIDLSGSWMVRLSLLPILVETYPEIEHVTLTAFTWKDQHRVAISNAVCQWTNLQTLEVNDLSYEGFMHVASLPGLRSLIVPDLSYVERMKSPAKNGFPALRKLSLTSSVMENCIGLLQFMSNTPLIEIIFAFKHHSGSTVWQELLSTIRQNCSLNSLRRVYIEDKKCDHPHFQDSRHLAECLIFIEHISPLFAFKLTNVILRPSAGFSFKPNDLRVIAKSWHHIVRLTLGTAAPTYVPTGIRLCDLSVLAKHCPKLVYLGITLDPTPLPATDTARRAYKGVSLRRLHVGDSSMSHFPLDVAEHLQDMFPNLASLETLDGDRRRKEHSTADFTSLEKRWRSVAKHLCRCSSCQLVASKRLIKTAESDGLALIRMHATATPYGQSE